LKCLRHPQSEASAICIHCGAGLCAVCGEKTANRRFVCSPECAEALAHTETVLNGIRRKTQGGHRLTGYFCCGVGVAILVFSLIAGFNRQWDLLALQIPLAIGLGVCGFFFLRLANRS